jgi:hypothetical protein
MTMFGILTNDKELHPAKQDSGIILINFGITTDDNDEHP